MDARAQAGEFRSVFGALSTEIGRVIVGQESIVEQLLTCLFVGGHGLIEGVPGLGKTRMVRTLSDCLDMSLSRIQFTPDLMPADIVGTNVIGDLDGKREFRFQPGPIFAEIVLADEINRATPRTQSALLEAMQESAVTVAGTRHPLSSPFLVLATQNPIEIEGTYPLPEAQVDRFVLKLEVGYPSVSEIRTILSRTTGEEEPRAHTVTDARTVNSLKQLVRTVPVPEQVEDYIARLLLATHPGHESAPEIVKRCVRHGASPRGGQALVMAGKVKALLAERFNVSFADVKAMLTPALAHRIILNFEGQADGVTSAQVIEAVERAVPRER